MSHIIVGAAGIGRHHARIFSSLGINISAILGSSQSTAELTASRLKKDYNIATEAFSKLDDLTDFVDIKSVSICSPTELHLDHLHFFVDRNIPIFCEKPLFWNWGFCRNTALDALNALTKNPNKMIFTNSSSEYYVNFLNLPAKINSFSFNFFTRGNHCFQDIAVDLMPHGLSMLYALLGDQKVTQYTEVKVAKNLYSSRFKFGSCIVNFNFKENELEREFSFSINEKKYHRLQSVVNGVYKVQMIDSNSGDIFKLADPFSSAINEFVDIVYHEKYSHVGNFQKTTFLQRSIIDALL